MQNLVILAESCIFLQNLSENFQKFSEAWKILKSYALFVIQFNFCLSFMLILLVVLGLRGFPNLFHFGLVWSIFMITLLPLVMIWPACMKPLANKITIGVHMPLRSTLYLIYICLCVVWRNCMLLWLSSGARYFYNAHEMELFHHDYTHIRSSGAAAVLASLCIHRL